MIKNRYLNTACPFFSRSNAEGVAFSHLKRRGSALLPYHAVNRPFPYHAVNQFFPTTLWIGLFPYLAEELLCVNVN